MILHPLWYEAAALAARAHRHQLRKDGRTPYAAHSTRVALVIAIVFGVRDETVLAAALLHDVIEDSGIDYDEIHERLGKQVADLCAVMTKDMRLVEDERERRYDEQLAAGPWQGRLIKLADVYDNLADSGDAATRRRFVEKARRALALARHDECLSDACDALCELVRTVERELDT